jgi:hypothetical protein
MIKPSKGNNRTSRHHSTFDPVELLDPMIDTKAQTLRTRRINPPMPVI